MRRCPPRVKSWEFQSARLSAGELDLAAAHVGLGVEDLPVQVRELDPIEVDDPQVADAHRGEVERRVRADAAEAEQADAGILEALLELVLARPERRVRLEEAEVPRPALDGIGVVEPVLRRVLEQAAAVELGDRLEHVVARQAAAVGGELAGDLVDRPRPVEEVEQAPHVAACVLDLDQLAAALHVDRVLDDIRRKCRLAPRANLAH